MILLLFLASCNKLPFFYLSIIPTCAVYISISANPIQVSYSARSCKNMKLFFFFLPFPLRNSNGEKNRRKGGE